MDMSDGWSHQVDLFTNGVDLYRYPFPTRHDELECMTWDTCSCFRCKRKFTPETLKRLVCRGEEALRKDIHAGRF